MEDFMGYIMENALVIIPVLYILGMILKGTGKIPENTIPVILLPIGIIFALFIVGFNVNGVVEGSLVTGAAVYVNHFITKQTSKNKTE